MEERLRQFSNMKLGKFKASALGQDVLEDSDGWGWRGFRVGRHVYQLIPVDMAEPSLQYSRIIP